MSCCHSFSQAPAAPACWGCCRILYVGLSGLHINHLKQIRLGRPPQLFVKMVFIRSTKVATQVMVGCSATRILVTHIANFAQSLPFPLQSSKFTCGKNQKHYDTEHEIMSCCCTTAGGTWIEWCQAWHSTSRRGRAENRPLSATSCFKGSCTRHPSE